MKVVKRFTAIKIVALGLSACLLSLSTTAMQSPIRTFEEAGKLKGVVVDWQYARVLGTKIVIESKTFKKEIQVNEDGEYEVELPPGAYQVRAQQPGFRQSRIRSIRVESNTVKTLNIMLQVEHQKFVPCHAGALCL